MWNYEGMRRKYEGICEKYEEICWYIGYGALIYLYEPWDLEKLRAPLSYSLCDLEKFRILLYMGLETWKNSTPELPPGLWDLDKFQVVPLYRLIQALGLGKIPRWSLLLSSLGLRKIMSSASIQVLGFEKMLSFPFLRLQPVGEVSPFSLLQF